MKKNKKKKMDKKKKMKGKKKPKKKKNKTESKIDIFHLILSTFHKSTCPTLEFCGQNQRGDAQSLRLLDCLMIQQPPRKITAMMIITAAATFQICLATYSIKRAYFCQSKYLWNNCKKCSVSVVWNNPKNQIFINFHQ